MTAGQGRNRQVLHCYSLFPHRSVGDGPNYVQDDVDIEGLASQQADMAHKHHQANTARTALDRSTQSAQTDWEDQVP